MLVEVVEGCRAVAAPAEHRLAPAHCLVRLHLLQRGGRIFTASAGPLTGSSHRVKQCCKEGRLLRGKRGGAGAALVASLERGAAVTEAMVAGATGDRQGARQSATLEAGDVGHHCIVQRSEFIFQHLQLLFIVLQINLSSSGLPA